MVLVIVLILFVLPAAAQMPPSPVGFTEARRHRVRERLSLPGTVTSSVVSLVASEVGGLVVEYPVAEGDTVKKGQLLARLNIRSLELSLAAATAQLKEAEARQKLAERNFGRAQELFESKVFSRQQLDDTLFEFNAWQGRIDNLTAEIERIEYDMERSVIPAPFDGVV
ncbi:MAG: efflux RND transporter periplasmic adaptor subunit, partial [bacterium]|nr:efflux RND transporter periplasmic adaptor subunit [bacterium]